MKSLFLFINISVFLSPLITLASEVGPCSNYAKYAAIRAYKAETGTIQGSSGIEYKAKLLGTQGDLSDYQVSIFDNNEDGDTWTLNYLVRVKGSGKICQIISVVKRN